MPNQQPNHPPIDLLAETAKRMGGRVSKVLVPGFMGIVSVPRPRKRPYRPRRRSAAAEEAAVLRAEARYS